MSDNRIIYAIGDVHGELQRLKELYREIEDYHAEAYAGRDRLIIGLGDYVDRGPDSAGTVAWLMAKSEAEPFICLKGNHEEMMVDAVRHSRNHDWWLDHGGAETMRSYQDTLWRHPPDTHLDWLEGLPTRVHLPDRKLVFVHAAINTHGFPNADERQHLWGRSAQFFDSANWDNPALEGYRVIHGHTPTDSFQPDISADGRRINVDTGAVYGGVMTAVVLAPDFPPAYLTA